MQKLNVDLKENYDHFYKWATKHDKSYTDHVEYSKKFEVFMANKKKIDEHNQKNTQWKMELNEFSDMTFEEFKSSRLMDPQKCSATKLGNHVMSGKPIEIPNGRAHFDWSMFGKVTPVKNQASCGSCWTFSTAACLESATAIHKHKPFHHSFYTLAEQQLVDCAQNFNNNGCNGGLPSQAFEYIKYSGGLQDEWDYKYTAKDGECKFNKDKAVAFVKDVVNITAGNEVELADAVLYKNPVSVAFDVVDDFMHYKSGVYSSANCGDTPAMVNHAVLAVGLGTDVDGVDYWIVKNSWGTQWGSDGYFMIERGSNMCGISDCASYPIVA